MTLAYRLSPLSKGSPHRRLLVQLDCPVQESLISLITRASAANAFDRQSQFLDLTGVETRRPEFVAFTRTDAVAPIAELLFGSKKIVQERLHPRVDHRGLEGVVDWFGTPLPRRFIEAERRRVSPSSLRKSAYCRSGWMIRPLTFCPYSFERLVDRCPYCSRDLGWRRTRGITLCEGCGKSLRRAPTSKIPFELRADAGAAARVIDCRPEVRVSAVNALPPPFNYWEAGDVFVAICELGMVESRLALPYRSPALRAFSNGDFAGFDVEELVAGYRIVRNWPTSFEALVRRAVAMHEHETQSLRSMLGALGKFLVPSASPTAITQLVREEMPAVAQSLKLPIKSARSAFMEGGRENGLITIAEIASQFQVDIKRLNQVGGSLHSLVTSSQCPRGVRLFDAAKVQAAFETRANAISTRKVCSRLGVLPFMLPALEEADILVEVGNHDARVLSAPDQIYQLEPIERLTARLFAPTVAAQSMPP